MSSGAVHREPSGAGQGAASTQQYYAHALDPAHNCTQKELHLAALGSLKGEILELSTRLKVLTQERDLLKNTLTVTQLEKVRVERESEDRLDSQAQHYEERLTELHSVIAELSRKIDQQRINVIAEEEAEVVAEEYSQSELSHDQHDATDSTSEAVESEEQMEEPRDHTATDASTSCDIDDRAVEIILACLAAVAVAAPQLADQPPIRIVNDERVDNGDGTFSYRFETENGIATNVDGQIGSVGQSNMAGSYR